MKPETRQFVKEYEMHRNPTKQKTVEDLAREMEKQNRLNNNQNEKTVNTGMVCVGKDTRKR